MLCKDLPERECILVSLSPGDINTDFDTLTHGLCTWFKNYISSKSCFASFLQVSATKICCFTGCASCTEFLRIPTCAIDADWCWISIRIHRESFIIQQEISSISLCDTILVTFTVIQIWYISSEKTIARTFVCSQFKSISQRLDRLQSLFCEVGCYESVVRRFCQFLSVVYHRVDTYDRYTHNHHHHDNFYNGRTRLSHV